MGQPLLSGVGFLGHSFPSVLRCLVSYSCQPVSAENLAKWRLVAELVSAFPTSGGMYFVTKKVFPPKDVPLAAWTIGWSNFLGQ